MDLLALNDLGRIEYLEIADSIYWIVSTLLLCGTVVRERGL